MTPARSRRKALFFLTFGVSALVVSHDSARAIEPDAESPPDISIILAAGAAARDTTLPPGVVYRLIDVPTYGLKIHAWTFEQNQFAMRTAVQSNDRSKRIAGFLRGPGDLFAINGGFFEKDKEDRLSASGLLIVDGKEVAAEHPRAGSGILYTDATGAHIRYRKNPPAGSATASALQTGPILVEPGGRMGMKGRKGDERHNRSAICLRGDAIVAVAVEGGLHLFDFAELLAAPRAKGGLGCEVAINLDGAGSTQAVFRAGAKTIRVSGETPVHNALVMSARK